MEALMAERIPDFSSWAPGDATFKILSVDWQPLNQNQQLVRGTPVARQLSLFILHSLCGESFFIFHQGNTVGNISEEDWRVKGDEALLCESMHGDDYDGLMWDFSEITFHYGWKRFQFVNITCGFHNEDVEFERCPLTKSGPLLLILKASLPLLKRVFGKTCRHKNVTYFYR